MGLFKRKYEKNVMRGDTFLKNYAIRINGLMRFTAENEKVSAELQKLQHDFRFTVATQAREAKKIEYRIEEKFETLRNTLQQPEWDENAVILMIRNIGLEIDEINALRQ